MWSQVLIPGGLTAVALVITVFAAYCLSRTTMRVGAILTLFFAARWLVATSGAPDPKETGYFWQRADDGADEVASGTLGRFLFGGPVDFGWPIWVLIGIGLVLGYRKLEAFSSRHEPLRVVVKEFWASDPAAPGSEGTTTSAQDAPGAGRRRDVELEMTRQLDKLAPRFGQQLPGPDDGAEQKVVATSWYDPSFLERAMRSAQRLLVPNRTLSLNGVVRTQPNGDCELTVRLSRGTDLLLVRTYVKPTAAEAVREASYAVAHASLLTAQELPAQRWWRTPEAMQAHQEGYTAHSRGQRAEARRHFNRAIGLEPRNPSPRKGLASTYEEEECFIPALTTYVRIAAYRPRFYEARYRLASSFAFVSEMAEEDLRAVEERQMQDLGRLLGELRAIPTVADNLWGGSTAAARLRPTENELDTLAHWNVEDGKSLSADEWRKFALRQCEAQFRELRRRLAWWPYLVQLCKHPETRAVYPGFLRPWGPRRRLHRTVYVALRIRKLREVAATPSPDSRRLSAMDREFDKRLFKRRCKRNFQALYNLACYHSLRLGQEQNRTDSAHARKAVDYLTQAYQAPRSNLSSRLDWVLRHDPDLEGLRGTPAFLEWMGTFVPAASKPADEVTALLHDLHAVWQHLTDLAAREHNKRRKFFDESAHRAEVPTGADLARLLRLEASRWRRIHRVAAGVPRLSDDAGTSGHADRCPPDEKACSVCRADGSQHAHVAAALRASDQMEHLARLSGLASRVSSRWEQRLDEAWSANTENAQKAVDPRVIVAWIEQSRDLWLEIKGIASADDTKRAHLVGRLNSSVDGMTIDVRDEARVPVAGR